MDIDLLALEPHKVSRDLRGYSVFFYGEPKSGKTTIASKFPNSLLLAFEKGYNALAGVMAQPINSWAEFIKVNRQLKDDKVKEKFATIIIDTSDIAYEYCEKYICNNNGVDKAHPHRFRRTFATNLAKRGMAIQEIQKILGHTNINTTMEYVALDNTQVEVSYRRHIA